MTTGKSPLKYYISHVGQNRMSTNKNINVQVLINNKVVKLVLSHAQGHVMLETVGVRGFNGHSVWQRKCWVGFKSWRRNQMLRLQLITNISSRLPPVTFETKCANNRGIWYCVQLDEAQIRWKLISDWLWRDREEDRKGCLCLGDTYLSAFDGFPPLNM